MKYYIKFVYLSIKSRILKLSKTKQHIKKVRTLLKQFVFIFLFNWTEHCPLSQPDSCGCDDMKPVEMFVFSGNPDAKRLYDDLLSNYNKLVRPVSNVSEVVTVKLKLKLSQLIAVVSQRRWKRTCFMFYVAKTSKTMWSLTSDGWYLTVWVDRW